MELKFMQNSASQKISALEKELKALKETLKAASVALGTKLLSASENATPQNYESEELLSTWTNCVEERKTGVMDKTGAKKRRSPYAVRLSGVESL